MKNAPTNQNLKINMNNYISLKFGCDYFGRDENILHREIWVFVYENTKIILWVKMNFETKIFAWWKKSCIIAEW